MSSTQANPFGSEKNAFTKYQELLRSYKYFQDNFNELIEYMIKINEPAFALKLFSPSNKALLFETNDKIIRHFVNYLSSAFSLIDHSRKYISRYDTTSLYIKYMEKKKIHFNANVCVLIKDLRQYSLHYEIPIASQNLSFNNNSSPLRNETILDVSDLLKSNYEWKSGSKEYFENNSLISVHILAYEYFRLVKEFYLWFFNEIKEYHKKDFRNIDGYIEE